MMPWPIKPVVFSDVVQSVQYTVAAFADTEHHNSEPNNSAAKDPWFLFMHRPL